jgi:hypothetical protein
MQQYISLLVKYSIALKQSGKNHPEVRQMWQQLKAFEMQLPVQTIIACIHEAFNPKPHTLTPQNYLP